MKERTTTRKTPVLSRQIPLSASWIDRVHRKTSSWFQENARDLPWRDPGCSPWGVLLSEVMLQQTPVARVLPVWEEWMRRWPDPAALAADPAGEAVRAWGRLGYPRRALRLHAAAVKIVEDYAGEVPQREEELRRLPGIGDYTAAAVAAFAFGQRSCVIDTNIRRVQARVFSGQALPTTNLTAAETRLAEQVLPVNTADSVRWNAACMELGALICTARSPLCEQCPLQTECSWLAQGSPAAVVRPKGQAWHGTDRQLRGAVMAVLRESEQPVPYRSFFASAGQSQSIQPKDSKKAHGSPTITQTLAKVHQLESDPERVQRIIQGLITDGLAVSSTQQKVTYLSLPL